MLKGESRRIVRQYVVVPTIALALASCSLFRPYSFYPAAPDDARSDIDIAIGYANSVRDSYLGAADDQASLSTLGGPTLIAIGAAAAGLGITGTSGNALTALTLSGAAGYGTLNWLRSPTREEAYVLGSRALTCVINAAQPAQSLSPAQRRQLKEAIGLVPIGTDDPTINLRGALANAQQQLALLKTAYAAFTTRADASLALTQSNRNISTIIDRADSMIAADLQVLQNGQDLDAKFSAAAANVMNGVAAVEDAVDAAVRSSVPSLATLPAVISQIQNSVTTTTVKTPAPAPAPSPGPSPPPLDQRVTPATAAALADLNTQAQQVDSYLRNTVASAAATVSDLTTAAQASSPPPVAVPAANCLTDLAQLPLGLTLSVTAVSLDPAAGGTWNVIVTGGKAPYYVNPSGAQAPAALTVSSPTASSGVFLITIHADANKVAAPSADTTYTWVITDSAASAQQLSVTVKKPSS